MVINDFNSRPCERGFRRYMLQKREKEDFNSRPCERGFCNSSNCRPFHLNFNSRPCERGFPILLSVHNHREISIHAPARGASAVLLLRLPLELFQFTPLREGLLCSSSILLNNDVFQFTPLREGLLSGSISLTSVTVFQFTPLREGLPWSSTYTHGD